MASDQNSIPVDLRPLNLTRAAVAEDPRIAPVSTSGRNIEGFFPNQARDVGSPIARPVYYPASIPDSGFVGVGYSNVSPGVAWCPRMPTAFAHAASVSSTGGQISNPNFSPQAGGSNASQASSEGGDDSVSGNKVKFLCSFGGKILPRPSDGMLRYVGGQTRIVGVRRDASFNELMQKLVHTCGHPVIIKYQLPDEDLDALVSISCRDDLDNMMDEYEKLLQRSSDGSCKLRLFLFSASEIDPPGMAHFGDLRDSGQRYVDAINGMVDEFRGGITRKESIASVASTQNSDLSGNDASDSLGTGQLDNTGPALSNILSPRENNGVSNETAQKIVLTEPNSSTFIATTSNLLGTPVKSTPQASLSSTDSEIERPIAFTRQHQPTGLTLQQPVVETPPAAPYLPSYMDSSSGAVNAQYLSSQMRFQNPQVFRTPGSVFTQPQFHENATSSHQYIAVQHMTIAPPSSNIGIAHPFMQAHQTQLENVPKQSTFWPRVVPLPGNQGFSAYQTHVPPAVLGGGYASQQVQPSGHVTSPDSWAAQPLVVFPERAPRLEDCYMCQKALPHAHSDTYAQDQKNSTVSSSNSAYHSLRPEDHRINWPLNKAGISGALGEGIVDMHGPAAMPGALVHMDNQGAPSKEPVGISQNLEVAHETEGFMPYKMDNPGDTMMSIAHGAMGMTGDVHSPYGAFVGTMPSYKVDAVPPLPVPTKFQNRPDNLLNKHAVPDGPPIVGVPSQYVEHVAYESPKEYSPKPSELVPKDEFVDLSSSHDTWRPINGRIENLKFQNISNEKNKPPVDMLRKDLLEHRQQFSIYEF